MLFSSFQDKAIAFDLIFLVMVWRTLAHHLFGAKTPASFVEGFLSGLGHPNCWLRSLNPPLLTTNN